MDTYGAKTAEQMDQERRERAAANAKAMIEQAVARGVNGQSLELLKDGIAQAERLQNKK
jgi:hypothetical protein